MVNILFLTCTLVLAYTGAPQPAQEPFRLSVEGAGSRGALVFSASGVGFDAADPKKSRRWPYHELKQIRVMTEHEIAFDTFEDGSRWRFGADRTITFDVTEDAVTSDLVAFLLEHIQRPLTSAVLPAGIGEPRARIDAKHLRYQKGTHGTIAIYAAGLAYEATEPADSRYWRFTDVESILRTSPYTLLINVYEHGSVRPFAFDLKAAIPDDAFDEVWNQVNKPTTRTGGTASPH